MPMNDQMRPIIEIVRKYESKIVLVVGFILIVVLSFEAGMVRGKNMKQSPLVVKETNNQAVCGVTAEGAVGAQNLTQETKKATVSAEAQAQNCVFVGSKNSNKYHRPSCSFAKRIKPENKVCFSSAEEAAGKGYLPDKGCVK